MVKISHYIQPSNLSSALVTIGKRSVKKKKNETFLFDRMLVKVVQVITLVVVTYFSFLYVVVFSIGLFVFLLNLLVSVAFEKAFKMSFCISNEVMIFAVSKFILTFCGKSSSRLLCLPRINDFSIIKFQALKRMIILV